MAGFARRIVLRLGTVLTGSSLGIALVGSIVMALVSPLSQPSSTLLRPLDVVSVVFSNGVA